MKRIRRRRLLYLGMSMAGVILVSGCGLLPQPAEPRVARIGFLDSDPRVNPETREAFLLGLRDAGWVEGQNLAFERRYWTDHPESIPDLAAELVALKPDVLVTPSTPGVAALMQATDTIPIVFPAASDPVGGGLIASLARPGGNVTGTSRTAGAAFGPKLLDLLRQIVPGLARVAFVYELGEFSDASLISLRETQAEGQSVGIDVQAVGIASLADLTPALQAALAGRPQALILSGGRFLPLPTASPTMVGFAMEHRLPTATYILAHKSAGSLIYYGPDLAALARRAGAYYVNRILQGAKPADLPVEQPTVFELAVNRTMAKALGITIPPAVVTEVTVWVD